jgi:hypothetical protein
VSGFLNFDEKIIATTIKLAHAKVSIRQFRRIIIVGHSRSIENSAERNGESLSGLD